MRQSENSKKAAGPTDGGLADLNRRIVNCRRCPRLNAYLREISTKKTKRFAEQNYWGKPVPNFGATKAKLLIVGLAPAAHGANRTGRMFTGDRSGDWLYAALHRNGFANRPHSVSLDDGLALRDCMITAVCHCAPPGNKPSPSERYQCRAWLDPTLSDSGAKAFLALGGIAWKETAGFFLREKRIDKKPPFSHGASIDLDEGRKLFASYHPSQQNTFTGRLTEPMFQSVFTSIRQFLDDNRFVEPPA